MMVTLMTVMGMKKIIYIYIYRWNSCGNVKWRMMNYWCLKCDLHTTRSTKKHLCSTMTYNGLIIDRQHFKISNKMSDLGIYNIYIYDIIHVKQNPQVLSGPYQLANSDFNSSMDLDIFLYKGKEFHKRAFYYRTMCITLGQSSQFFTS